APAAGVGLNGGFRGRRRSDGPVWTSLRLGELALTAFCLCLRPQYVFVSLLSRDSVYDVLRRICTHLQVNGKSLSLKQYLEEPSSLSMDEFPEVLKWRRKPSLPAVSSSLPDLLGNSTPSLAATTTFSAHTLTDCSLETEKILLTEPVPELGHAEYQLLRLFILLVFLLVLSSCYLAFRVCRLEQQLSFLSSQPTLRESSCDLGRRRDPELKKESSGVDEQLTEARKHLSRPV
ncbi:GRAM domain-containing protein 2A-like, partial [Neolamprologus brichardi]|uniref:GRAM domain-containing protein 2A-like n=1 Tax=Neolamprologus brichardi TaxID=32507 RepID=UPI0003EC0379